MSWPNGEGGKIELWRGRRDDYAEMERIGIWNERKKMNGNDGQWGMDMKEEEEKVFSGLKIGNVAKRGWAN
jgi:hypothetical protein